MCYNTFSCAYPCPCLCGRWALPTEFVAIIHFIMVILLLVLFIIHYLLSFTAFNVLLIIICVSVLVLDIVLFIGALKKSSVACLCWLVVQVLGIGAVMVHLVLFIWVDWGLDIVEVIVEVVLLFVNWYFALVVTSFVYELYTDRLKERGAVLIK